MQLQQKSETVKILVVDDDITFRLMMKQFLQGLGYEVIEAESGEEALEKYRQEEPLMILMEGDLPGMDGFQTCAAIKAQPGAKETPILMITRLAYGTFVDRAFEAGAADYLRKPVQWPILRNRIHYLLRSRKAQEELLLAASVFENAAEAILVSDKENHIIAVNPAFCRITGYSEEEVLGHNPSILSSGRHDEEFYQQLWESLKSKGSWEGEIWNRRKNGETYPEWLAINTIKDSSGEVVRYVGMFSDITRRKQYEQDIWYQANFDLLTGLPNRSLLIDRLGQAIEESRRNDRQVAVLLIDLDHFKEVNDTLGHPAGDKLLQEIARRLVKCVRSTDTVARLGGDEFVIVLTEIKNNAPVEKVVENILKHLAEPVEVLPGQNAYVSGSVGITLSSESGDDIDALLKHADTAMYRAKAAGRNGYEYFTEEMNRAAIKRMEMDRALRQAIMDEEFILYFQPIHELASGRIVGVESLLRWPNPQHGMMLPEQFIALAEETGLIEPLGNWALHQAIKVYHQHLLKWQTNLKMAVNVSMHQCQDQCNDFVSSLLSLIREYELPPGVLELEFTESLLIGHSAGLVQRFRQLREMGVSLVLDEFGSGCSSLSYLKNLPINKVKIGRSFICDIDKNSEDANLVEAVIAMARALRLSVVTEGIENRAQFDFLKQAGCEQGQGYYFSPPLPLEDLVKLLEEDDASPVRNPEKQ